MSYYLVLTVVFAVWGVAVAIKAVSTLRGGPPYVFSMWDGGLLRVGKQLNRIGAQIKLVTGLVISGGCVMTLAEVGMRQIALLVLIGAVAVGLVSDFINAGDPGTV